MSKAETDVQFFSHLNGISLDNKWGEMINLLDTCLVNGLTLPNISNATIADDGRMTINFKSAHNCLLFQCVTLSGFSPSTLNDKYRIVGVPSTTQLLLSTDLTAQTVITVGTAVLSPLGYEIVFSANTKRVYRALNPTTQHPFIRVDESRASADGTGVYDDSYAKSAMVGLIENMTHVDDYQDPNKLQLPLDTLDFTKNWKISGTGSNVVRGWSRWYWAMRSGGWNTSSDSILPTAGNRNFTLMGNSESFYLLNQTDLTNTSKFLKGCGLFNSSVNSSTIPNWFLMSFINQNIASESKNIPSSTTGSPLMRSGSTASASYFLTPSCDEARKIKSHSFAIPLLPSGVSGADDVFSSSNAPALEIPFYDDSKYLRGALKHVCYAGKRLNIASTTPIFADTAMYIADCASYDSSYDGLFFFYLGNIA